MKKLLATLFVLSIISIVNAQSKHEWGIESRFKSGFLAAHRGVMGHLTTEHAFAGELSFFVQTKGKKEWHSVCNYPTVGGTLFGGTAGNMKILGSMWGAYAFIEFPFIKSKWYEFSGKFGSGLGYVTKVFNYENNPKNVAISTHINTIVSFGVKSRFKFGTNSVTLGLDMTHFSNAASKVPNLGINMPYLSLGYSRMIRLTQMDSIPTANKLPFKKWLFNFTAIGSMKEMFPTGGKKYAVYALSSSARWFAKPKVGMEFGLDLISKQAILDYRPEVEKTQWDIFQIGIFGAYLVPLDRFHFGIGMGVYVKDKFQPEDALYHRISLRYYLDNGLNFNIGLKSHWARADYAEWGLGYTINYKR